MVVSYGFSLVSGEGGIDRPHPSERGSHKSRRPMQSPPCRANATVTHSAHHPGLSVAAKPSRPRPYRTPPRPAPTSAPTRAAKPSPPCPPERAIPSRPTQPLLPNQAEPSLPYRHNPFARAQPTYPCQRFTGRPPCIYFTFTALAALMIPVFACGIE